MLILHFADALADTFYSVGFVMSLCQLLSILELFHIADGIEKARLLPRFVQVRITARWSLTIHHVDVLKYHEYGIMRSLEIWSDWWIVHADFFTGYGEEHPTNHGHHTGGDSE